MNILIIEYRDITHPEAGGAEVILHTIFSRLAQRGHQIDYLCSRYKGAPSEDSIDGIRIIRRGGQATFNYAAPLVYVRELRRKGYDIVVEGIDKIPFFIPLFEKKVPVLCVIPHLFGTTVFREALFPLAVYVCLFERPIPQVYARCRFSVLSESTKSDLVRRGIPSENISVIHSGLDHTFYCPPDRPLSNRFPTLLYLGRIKKYKGIDLVIRAVKRLSGELLDLQFWVVGSGDYLEPLKQFTRSLGLEDHVRFLGYKAGEEKIRILQKADIVLYTSPKEGWGLSVIEANACGTPVIASNSPGLRESVLDGETGFVVEHGNIEELSEKIRILLTDAKLRDDFSRNAVRWAKTFDWETSTNRTLALIEGIVLPPGEGT